MGVVWAEVEAKGAAKQLQTKQAVSAGLRAEDSRLKPFRKTRRGKRARRWMSSRWDVGELVLGE